jgi:hypothetical protein
MLDLAAQIGEEPGKLRSVRYHFKAAEDLRGPSLRLLQQTLSVPTPLMRSKRLP